MYVLCRIKMINAATYRLKVEYHGFHPVGVGGSFHPRDGQLFSDNLASNNRIITIFKAIAN